MTVISGLACIRGRVGGRERELAGVGAGGSGWEAKGGLHLPLGRTQWCYVFSKGQIQAQSTG